MVLTTREAWNWSYTLKTEGRLKDTIHVAQGNQFDFIAWIQTSKCQEEFPFLPQIFSTTEFFSILKGFF